MVLHSSTTRCVVGAAGTWNSAVSPLAQTRGRSTHQHPVQCLFMFSAALLQRCNNSGLCRAGVPACPRWLWYSIHTVRTQSLEEWEPGREREGERENAEAAGHGASARASGRGLWSSVPHLAPLCSKAQDRCVLRGSRCVAEKAFADAK